MAYSSRRPFDFNAGGKGADLLRMKIFSERYNFKINMTSSRCQLIPEDSDICPGRISRCVFCKGKEVCYHLKISKLILFYYFNQNREFYIRSPAMMAQTKVAPAGHNRKKPCKRLLK